MSEQQNTDRVLAFFGALGEGDMDAALACLAEDVTWQTPPQHGVPMPWKQTYNGRDGVAAFFADCAACSEENSDVRGVIAGGDKVVVLVHQDIRSTKNDRSLSQDMAIVATLADDKVTECLLIEDSLGLVNLFGEG